MLCLFHSTHILHLSPAIQSEKCIFNIYIYAFSRCFYPKWLTCTLAIFFVSMCVPWETHNLLIIIINIKLRCHIHNYTEYNQQWNVFYAFNPSKCTHTWSSGQPTLRRPGSSWGFGALLKGHTSVVANSCRSRDSNPQPQVTSPMLYPLEPRLPLKLQSEPARSRT